MIQWYKNNNDNHKLCVCFVQDPVSEGVWLLQLLWSRVRMFFKECFSSCAGRSKEAIDRLYHPTVTAESLSWSWWSWPPTGSASSHANKELNTVFPWAITLLFHQPVDSIDQCLCGGNVVNRLWDKGTETAKNMLKENKRQVAMHTTKHMQSNIAGQTGEEDKNKTVLKKHTVLIYTDLH